MAQQALRREHDQRQRIGLEQQRLPPQQMEVLRGRRAVGDAHVDVGRRLQEPLEPRARMIGSLALVAVRQQHHQRRRQSPLGAARRDELVEHDLRAVDEIAVLRFPDHEAAAAPGCCSRTRSRARRSRRAGCCGSRTRRARAAAPQRHVLFAGDGVVQHGVPMAEGAAFDVFAGEPDRRCRPRESTQTPAPRPSPSRSVASSASVEHRRRGARGARSSLRCTVKPSGTFSSSRLSAASRSSGTAVCTRRAAPLGGGSGIGGT